MKCKKGYPDRKNHFFQLQPGALPCSNVYRLLHSSRLPEVEKGIKRFIVGFAKKVFLANAMGNMADIAFDGYAGLNSQIVRAEEYPSHDHYQYSIKMTYRSWQFFQNLSQSQPFVSVIYMVGLSYNPFIYFKLHDLPPVG